MTYLFIYIDGSDKFLHCNVYYCAMREICCQLVLKKFLGQFFFYWTADRKEMTGHLGTERQRDGE